MFSLALLELTLREVVTEVPHDLGAVIAYFLLACFVAGIVYGSRTTRPSDPPGDGMDAPGS